MYDTNLQVVYVSTDELQEYKNNSKLHPSDHVEQIAESIEEFGFNNPILAWHNNEGEAEIVAGHGRLMAARNLGIEELPVVFLDHLNDEARRAYLLVDNQLTMNTGFDFNVLSEELEGISSIDMEVYGFVSDDEEELEEVHPYDEPVRDRDHGDEPSVSPGDRWVLGDHVLVCGDSTTAEAYELLMGNDRADLLLTDPPYNVDYASKNRNLNKIDKGNRVQKEIDNDSFGSDEDFTQFLMDSVGLAMAHVRPGGSWYVWFAVRKTGPVYDAMRAIGAEVRQELYWLKNMFVIGRQDYQWQTEPCQPAGTMVSTPDGDVPIEMLRDGDRVLSYDSMSGAIKGYKNGGYEVVTASRDYEGTLYGVRVCGMETWATDNHEFSVRFNKDARKNYCTYLMRRGDWWRVGITKAYDARQFGIKTRCHQEHADEAWLISMHETRAEAQVYEQILSVKYGIPYTIWEPGRFNGSQRTKEHICRIYGSIDLAEMRDNAIRLLRDHRRSERFPLVCGDTSATRFSTRTTSIMAACNLIPELMQVPVPTNPSDMTNFEWRSIDGIDHKDGWSGRVYSLSVRTHHHYVADGIVTHNCLYGWTEGATHWFAPTRSERNFFDELPSIDSMGEDELRETLRAIASGEAFETDLIREDKPQVSDLHPTMKPVGLFQRLIRNSSREGDLVLDPFGGSGTTIVACENMGRRARVIEIDPEYCAKAIARWEQLTGLDARLDTEGQGGM